MKSIKKKILLVLPAIAIISLLLFTNSCSNDLDLLFPEWDNAPATTPLSSKSTIENGRYLYCRTRQ